MDVPLPCPRARRGGHDGPRSGEPVTPRRRRILLGALLLLLGFPIAVGVGQYIRDELAPPADEDTRLFVRRAGEGRAVLAIHGLAASGRYFLERGPALTEGLDIIAPDLLGFGASPRVSGPYTLESHAALVEKALRDQGTGGPVLVVGHSLGAIVALELARRAPELVDQLVLVSLPIFEDRADAAERLQGESMMAASVAREDALARLSCQLHSLYGIPWLAPLFDLPEDVFVDGTRHTWPSLSGTLDRAILEVDVPALARQVKRPITFAHGARDLTADIARVAPLAEELGAPLVRHPTGGHQVILEDPGWLGDLLRQRATPGATE